MKRLLLTTAAAIGLFATGAQAFQANNPPPRQQPQQNYVQREQQNGWNIAKFTDDFTDHNSIAVYRVTADNAVIGARCMSDRLQATFGIVNAFRVGEMYPVEVRIDKGAPFSGEALAVTEHLLEIYGEGTDDYLNQLAAGKQAVFRILVNNVYQTKRVDLAGAGNAVYQVFKTCATYQDNNRTSERKGGKDA